MNLPQPQGEAMPGRRSSAIIFLIVEGLASLSIAMAIFAVDVWVFKKTGSYAIFASLALLAALPAVFVSPLVGPVIDRIPRGMVILGCSLLVVLAGSCAALYSEVFQFSVFGAGLLLLTLALVQTIRWPTLLATVSSVSPPDDVERITAYEESVEAAVVVAAPILGAAVMGQFGISTVFGLLVFPFVGSIASVFFLALPRRISLAGLQDIFRQYLHNFWPDFTFGFRWIKERKNIFRLLIYICVLNFGANIFVTMQVPLALLLFDAKQVAAILASGGVGLVIGGLVVSLIGTIRPPIRAIYLGSAGITLGIAIYSISTSIVQSALGAFVFMFFHPFVNTAIQVLWRKQAPLDKQGAIFSVRRAFTSALAPLAIALSVPISVHLAGPMVSGMTRSVPQAMLWPTEQAAMLGFTLVMVALTTWMLIIFFHNRKFLESGAPE